MPIDRKPSEEFSPFIDAFWRLPGKGGGGESPLEILPDAHFTLGFGLSAADCRVLVAGPCTKAVEISVTDTRDFFFVRFRPGRLPRILGLRPAELVDETEVDLPGLLGRFSTELGERLSLARDPESAQSVLESFLRQARAAQLCQDRRCRRAVEVVEAHQGRLKVSELARETGLSARTLERMFLDQIGLTPNRFIRNLRFQRAVRLLRARPPRMTLGRLAHECGYADQTHFIDEFKAFTGRLPSAL